MFRRCAIVLVVASVASAAQAQVSNVFNMPAGQTSLQFVTVGDPGNAPDTVVETDGTTGYGSVGYAYQMGKYDVTVGQYCQFLNAVARTDTYGLYNTNMNTTNNADGCNITRSGLPGSYVYSVASDWANRPVNFVSWGDSARFCNWLDNAQPTGSQGPNTTETGAYTMNGATTNSTLMEINRNAGATYFLPSENEWYKAAYYKGGSTTAGYWTYPTQSNAAPSNMYSTTGTNNADYDNGGYTIGGPYYRTEVGAFAASPGPYGTYDMGGDVWQWNDSDIYGAGRGIRGGAFDATSSGLASSYRQYAYYPTDETYSYGFRVASVPGGGAEPGDANGDGRVDINDLTIVLAHYGHGGMAWSQGDFYGTGFVDINDLTAVLANFGVTYRAGPAAVPEPAGLALLGIGAIIGLLAFTWRGRQLGRGTSPESERKMKAAILFAVFSVVLAQLGQAQTYQVDGVGVEFNLLPTANITTGLTPNTLDLGGVIYPVSSFLYTGNAGWSEQANAGTSWNSQSYATNPFYDFIANYSTYMYDAIMNGAATYNYNAFRPSLTLLWGSVDTDDEITFTGTNWTQTLSGTDLKTLIAQVYPNYSKVNAVDVTITPPYPFTELVFSHWSTTYTFEYSNVVTTTTSLGDANNDGRVDINDLTIVLADFGKTGMNWEEGDFNEDGKVDINDLTIVLANFGKTSATDVAEVPEPAGMILFGIGAIGLLAFAWRRRAGS